MTLNDQDQSSALLLQSCEQTHDWTCCKKVDSTFEIFNDYLGGTNDTQTFYRRLSQRGRSIGLEQ